MDDGCKELLENKIGTNSDHIKELQLDRDVHEKRITALEISDGKILAQIEHLIASVNSLVGWIKGLIGAMVMSLLGFFIWYVQNIGR